jgi:acetyl-CoA carboxylase biotin carboxylase subunit
VFRKLLIANRGEIALRIMRTCRRLGVKTVAVYSEPDVTSKHVFYADEAYSIGPGEPSQSYLNIPKIIEIARKSGAESVHPGYGFLAENPSLARAVEEAGMVFVGPRAKVLSRIASKLEAKKKVSENGVPAIPGSPKELESVEQAEREAQRIGYPVLLKATYGGGGRGMRVIRKPTELRRMMEIASTEAKSGFGRSGLYVEKYLESPRHIEVQVLCGPHGKIVHLGERECSMQRRYQKILEETPSPVVTPEERKRLCRLALKAASTLNYENAGTVEFVRSKAGEYYYMELNKRIQVEHLITELVTRVDIVEQQLRISSGEGLGLSQDEIVAAGWAINCRINAEDPEKGFAPSPGRVTKYQAPTPQWVRVDTALYDGCYVPEFYDSLIAKLASNGSDRMHAIQWMRSALEEMVVEGVKTTIPVQKTIMDYPSFVKGEYHTQLLEEILLSWKPISHVSLEETAAAYLTATRAPPEGLAEQNGRRSAAGWKKSVKSTEGITKRPLYIEGL